MLAALWGTRPDLVSYAGGMRVDALVIEAWPPVPTAWLCDDQVKDSVKAAPASSDAPQTAAARSGSNALATPPDRDNGRKCALCLQGHHSA